MKVPSLYVISPTEWSGKTSVIVSMALKASELGKRVGYFKPIGYGVMAGEPSDEDAKNVREILNLKEELGDLCPIVLDRQRFLEKTFSRREEIRERIISCYKKVSDGKDLMLIDGPNSIFGGTSIKCAAPELAREFGSKIIIIVRVRDDSFIDELLLTVKFCEDLGVPPAGVILNRVPEEYPELERITRSVLESEGIELLGSIPNRDILGALRVREIQEFLGGEVIAGKEGMDNLVQNFLVGAMSMESAMRYFRKTTNKAVIVGGDRTDIISAALETGTSAIIVTGNLYPSVKILPRADEVKTPIIVVPYDTYTTLNMIQGIVGRIKPNDTGRLNLMKKLFEENVKWERVLK
ncbi:MAG: DRTGG domain-containing protein [Candidatus Hadarchaeales archaeon]